MPKRNKKLKYASFTYSELLPKVLKRASREFYCFMLCSCILLSANNSIATPQTIDSLKNLLIKKHLNDTSTALLCVQISVEYHNKNVDSQVSYAQKALHSGNLDQYPVVLSRVYTQNGGAQFARSNFDSAIYYYDMAHNLLINAKAQNRLPNSYLNIGNVYLRQNELIKALTYYDSAITWAQKEDNQGELGRAYSNTANVYYEQGDYTAAIEYYLKSMDIQERMDKKQDLQSTYSNLGNIYTRLGDYESAKRYIQLATDAAKEQQSNWSLVSAKVAYGMIYNEEKKFDSSLRCMQDALILAEDMNSSYLLGILKSNIGECYHNMKQYHKAYNYYNEALKICQEINDKQGVAIAKSGIGQVLVAQGKNSTGILYLTEAYDELKEEGNLEQTFILLDTLSNVFEKTGDYKSALKYAHLRDEYADSLDKKDVLKTVHNLEFQYQLDKQKARIELLEKDHAIETERAKNQQLLLITSIIGFILVTIIAILVFRNLRIARKRNKIILEQKAEIEEQAQKLAELNKFKDTTFSVLSHDLRSPINALTGTMAMLDEGIMTPEEFSQHKVELDNKLQSVSLMLDNLLQWATVQMRGEHTLNIEKINVQRKILRGLAVSQFAAEQKNITITGNVSNALFALGDRNQIEMVVRNLLSNAIKFTPAGGNITYSAEKQGDMVAIKISDSGVGMPKELVNKLFDGKTNNTTTGTNGEKGTGIGLHLSHEFILNNGGDILVESEEGKGTTFTILLPATERTIA